MKKVSVIIPTYKRSTFLIRAVESVLAQTYKNIELIVVDDNDPDSVYRKENEEKLKKYIDNNSLTYLKHPYNKNGAAARNTGINYCNGDYITFLDDDDFYLKDRLQLLIDLLENNKDYDCAYSSMVKIKNESLYNYRVANKNGDLIDDVLCQYSFFGTGSNMLFTRKSVDKIGLFDETFFRFQDLEYMIRFFYSGFKTIALDDVLVVKCEEDKMNVPEFKKMKLAKEQFIEKFDSIINKKNTKNNIKYSIYRELYIFSSGREHTIAKKILSKYKRINFKDKVLYLYSMLTIKFTIFRKMDEIIRKIRCIGKITSVRKNEMKSFINGKKCQMGC